MARVTVEDCITRVPNRFELVLLAGQRARDISSGVKPTLERNNDKNPVIALREIAEPDFPLDHLNNALIEGLQRNVQTNESEPEEMDSFMPEGEIELASMLVEDEALDDGYSISDEDSDFGAVEPDDEKSEDV